MTGWQPIETAPSELIERLVQAIGEAKPPGSRCSVRDALEQYEAEYSDWVIAEGKDWDERIHNTVTMILRLAVRAALEALREPTEAMVEAMWVGNACDDDIRASDFPRMFTAAIDAALEPPEGSQPGASLAREGASPSGASPSGEKPTDTKDHP